MSIELRCNVDNNQGNEMNAKLNEVSQHTPGCSNPDCTYSTCRAKWERVRAAAPDLLEALQYVEATGDATAYCIKAALAKAGL